MTIPLFAGLWFSMLVLAPVLLTLTIVLDLSRPRGKPWPHTRCLVFFIHYLNCEVAGVVAAIFTWLWSGVWAGAPRERLLRADAALQRVWSNCLFLGAIRIFSMRLEIHGAEVAARGPYILFVRHASTADTALAAAVVANPFKVLLRYTMKRELLWDPCLDIVGNRLPNVFLARSGAAKDRDVEAVRSLAVGITASDGILVFPEGTRFSHAKLEAARARLCSGDPVVYDCAMRVQRVLPPRLGGATALMEAAPHLDAVFFAHTGFDGAVSFADFWNGALVGRTVQGRLWRVPAAKIPSDATARAHWLCEQWLEVDTWVRAHADDRSSGSDRTSDGVATVAP